MLGKHPRRYTPSPSSHPEPANLRHRRPKLSLFIVCIFSWTSLQKPGWNPNSESQLEDSQRFSNPSPGWFLQTKMALKPEPWSAFWDSGTLGLPFSSCSGQVICSGLVHPGFSSWLHTPGSWCRLLATPSVKWVSCLCTAPASPAGSVSSWRLPAWWGWSPPQCLGIDIDKVSTGYDVRFTVKDLITLRECCRDRSHAECHWVSSSDFPCQWPLLGCPLLLVSLTILRITTQVYYKTLTHQ